MSENYEFLVQSSDGVSSYSVEIMTSDLDMAVKCSCPAGVKNKLCKHKVRLLDNDVDILVDKRQKDALSLVLHRSQEKTALIELRRYREAELTYNDACASFAQAKKRLEKMLRGN